MPQQEFEDENVMEIDAEPAFPDKKPEEPIKPVPKAKDSVIKKLLKSEISLKKAQLKLQKAQHELGLQEAYKWVEISKDGKDKDLGLTNDTKRASYVKIQTAKFTDDVFEAQKELVEPEAEYNQLIRIEKRERLELLVRLLATKEETPMLLELLR